MGKELPIFLFWGLVAVDIKPVKQYTYQLNIHWGTVLKMSKISKPNHSRPALNDSNEVGLVSLLSYIGMAQGLTVPLGK